MKTIRGKEGDPLMNIRMRTTMKMREKTRKLVRTDEDENAKTEDRRGTLVLVLLLVLVLVLVGVHILVLVLLLVLVLRPQCVIRLGALS